MNRRSGREVVLNSVDHTASFMADRRKVEHHPFGLFELDLQARELRKSGIRIKLQEQPFQILSMLLERQGQIVTREELQKRLWPGDTFVDFDLSLNSAVKKLRQALNDDSENPRFIETLYRRGYRFIAPISTASRERDLPVVGNSGILAVSAPVSNQAPDAGNGAGSLSESGRSGETAGRSRKRWAFIAVGCLAVLFAGLIFELNPKAAPRITGFTQITSGGKVHQMSALATDGQRLYFQAADRDRIALGEVSVFRWRQRVDCDAVPEYVSRRYRTGWLLDPDRQF